MPGALVRREKYHVPFRVECRVVHAPGCAFSAVFNHIQSAGSLKALGGSLLFMHKQ